MSEDAQSELVDVVIEPELQDWLDRFPMPEGTIDADMNQAQIAQAFQVSTNTVGKWIAQLDFPIAVRGGQGRPHVLRLSHVYAWREARRADEVSASRKADAAISAMQASFLNLDVDADPNAGLSPKMVKEMAQADLVYSQAAQQRRQLLRVDDVADLFEAVFSIMRQAMETLPDRLERDLDLTPEQVSRVVSIASETLKKMSNEIEKAELIDADFSDEGPKQILI